MVYYMYISTGAHEKTPGVFSWAPDFHYVHAIIIGCGHVTTMTPLCNLRSVLNRIHSQKSIAIFTESGSNYSLIGIFRYDSVVITFLILACIIINPLNL